MSRTRPTPPLPATVTVIGPPAADGVALPPTSAPGVRLLEALPVDAAFSARDVVVLRWVPGTPAEATLAALMSRPESSRPRVVVAGDVAEAALRSLIEVHGVVHVVGTRSASAALDLAVTVDKLVNNELFGLARYFGAEVDVARFPCRLSSRRDEILEWVRGFAEQHRINTRIVDLLAVVADEMVTNAFYNAPVDGDGAHRHARLDRTVKVELTEPETIEIELRCDGGRLGIATSDPFGSLEPDVVLGSLRRCFAAPVPRTGPGGAGLGLYLLVGALSHVVFNVARGRRTEVIGLFEVAGGYRKLLTAGKSFNLFTER